MMLQMQAMAEQQTVVTNRFTEQQNAMTQLQLQLNAAVERADRAQQTTADLAKVSAAAVGR